MNKSNKIITQTNGRHLIEIHEVCARELLNQVKDAKFVLNAGWLTWQRPSNQTHEQQFTDLGTAIICCFNSLFLLFSVLLILIVFIMVFENVKEKIYFIFSCVLRIHMI